jgi:membrane associated rhomboid family serine protease
MMDSLWDDFKYNISKSTRLNQIILINVSVFIILLLARIILNIADGGNQAAFANLSRLLSLNTDLAYLIRHPWILISHMFTHIGIWHLIWNMVSLYWFGNIVGDLLGDKFIWRVYLFSGLAGALVIILFSTLFHFPSDIVIAHGASAAVMGFVLAAAVIAPDYLLHLMIIGSVRLKYVALVVILIDLAGIADGANTGGHIGHLGGAIGGALFIWLLRNGISLMPEKREKSTETKIIPMRKAIPATGKQQNSDKGQGLPKDKTSILSKQEKIDLILDKIRAKGINSLTKEEKELLDRSND